jgi:CRP/FNR family transcriptional regulator
MPAGLPDEALDCFERIVHVRRRIPRGERLFSANDRFRSIYAVRSGFFKTCMGDAQGREQVTGFFMSGELLGLDGLRRGCCECSATALEDSDVCSMPYALIEAAGLQIPALQRRLHIALAGEITRSQRMQVLLGSMRGEQRLASFLIDLSRRFLHRGYSGSSFSLRMTRSEIGSYIGLTLETVSRLFSAFQRGGLITVQHKQVCNLDVKGLERLVASDA